MSKGEDTRKAILRDALAEVSLRGMDGLTIGNLAKKTGLSKSGLYAHFESKEALQIRVLEEAREGFIRAIVTPGLKAPRGEPRIRAFFERWIDWESSDALPGGCPFIAAAAELDDQPGPVRDYLVQTQRDWVETLRGAARIAVDEGHFRADLDVAQWAYELWGLVLSYHWYARLLEAEDARARLDAAFDALIARSRA